MERSDARPLVHRVIIERRQFSEDSVSLSFFSALVVASLIIGSLASHAQVLSYSAYTDLVLLPQIAVNASGEECVPGNLLLTKFNSAGSEVYSIAVGEIGAIAIDSQGDCYIAGNGAVTPTPGAFQPVAKSVNPQFIEKFDASGNLIYATYLGGSISDSPAGMAVDSNSNVYLTGTTTSNDFPTLNAYQPALSNGPPDAFISVLNPSGNALLYSTYWGGANIDKGAAIAADSSGNAYITGQTYSYDFPVVSAFQGMFAGNPYEAFVIKLDPTGKPIYSTYFGGSNPGSNGFAIAADVSGSAYVAGVAGPGMPLQNPIQSTTSDFSAFVSKFNSNGSALVYSTYLGENTTVAGVAVDSNGQAYLGGSLLTNLMPEGSLPLASPIQNSFGTGTILGTGTSDGFVSVLNASGSALVFSTYLGGDQDGAQGFAIDGATPTPNVYLTGSAACAFPVTNAPVTTVSNGTYVPFIAGLDAFPCAGGQFFLLKISLSSGTSFSYPATVDLTKQPQPVGNSSAAVPVLIANTSAAGDISINSVAIQGDFSQTNNCPSTLTAATSCKVLLTFTPTVGGQRTGTITITDSFPGSPHIISLLGAGAVPVVQIAPTSLSFPPQALGTTSADQVVTLTNTGNAALAISRISTTGDFSESNLCGYLSPATNCQIKVTFTPTVTGARTGVLTIADSASGSPQTVTLSGTGAGAGLGFGIAPGGSPAATVAAGAKATYSLIIGGAGLSGTASLTCTGAPTGATCSIPATASVAAQTPAVFTASVQTTAPTTSALRSPWMENLAWPWTTAIIAGFVLCPRTRRKRPTGAPSLAALTTMTLLTLVICSCGGSTTRSQSPTGTPAGTYNLSVSATVGSTTQITSLTLIVQ